MSYTSSNTNLSNDPFSNFISVLEDDPNPNFLWYTLHILEKSVMSQSADLLKTIREKMEKKYQITVQSPWEKKE